MVGDIGEKILSETKLNEFELCGKINRQELADAVLLTAISLNSLNLIFFFVASPIIARD